MDRWETESGAGLSVTEALESAASLAREGGIRSGHAVTNGDVEGRIELSWRMQSHVCDHWII